MKFCCDKFEEALKRNRRQSPNIRIVEFVSERFVNPSNEIRLSNDVVFYNEKMKTGPYRFYITTGYTQFNFELPSFFIEFCPFCGINLYSFYKNDIDANEIEGITF